MIAYTSLIFLFFLLFSFNSNNYFDGLKKSYLVAVFMALFVILFNALPATFASDQYEYYEIIKDRNFENLPYKVIILSIVSYIPISAEFGLTALRLFLYILCIFSFIYYGQKITNSLLKSSILLLIPSIAIHSSLFLREPLVYAAVIAFVFYILNRKFFLALIFWIFVASIRQDTAILIFPLFLFFFRKDWQKSLFAILGITFTYFALIYFEPLNIFLNGYRNIWGIQHDILSTPYGIFSSILNFLLGSKSLDFATFLLFLESIFLIYILLNLNNKTIPFAILLLGILTVGSLSDSSGFILRIRSVIMLIFLLLYFNEKTVGKKKNS